MHKLEDIHGDRLERSDYDTNLSLRQGLQDLYSNLPECLRWNTANFERAGGHYFLFQ